MTHILQSFAEFCSLENNIAMKNFNVLETKGVKAI